MFYHRVLPPPSSLHAATDPPLVAGSRAVRRDTLLENKIMPGEEAQETVEKNQHHRKANRSISLQLDRDDPDTRSAGSNERSPSSPSHHLRSSARLGRKRAASPGSVDSHRDPKRDLLTVPAQGRGSKPVESPSQVCLCQPDPKVPRPRNAFILFRQHHQAAVVAKNPGLANPEISKIIGDSWRTASADTKTHWKRLAEEEKVRHQKQYPDYRYQPRRAGRNAATNGSSDSEGNRCHKCGGTVMAAPQHLPTPGLPQGSPMSPRGRPPSTPASASARYRNPHYPGSPGMPPIGMTQRPYGSLASSSSMSRHPSRLSVRGADMAALPMSPDPKRRRYDNGAASLPPGAIYGAQRPSLPRPEFLPRPPFHMANPPPRSQPGPSSRDDGRSGGSGGPTLAPLHTAGSTSSSRDGNGSDAQAQSVAAMIQSIAPLNKIRLLAKISRPLATPGPASPPHPVRGALVAIEGNDDVALDAVSQHLTDALGRDGDFRVRVFARPDWLPPKSGLSNADCLALIQKYHAQSAEIASFITNPGDAAPPPSDSPQAATAVDHPPDAAGDSESPVSPKTVKPQPPAKSTRSHSGGGAEPGPDADAMDVDTSPTTAPAPAPAPAPPSHDRPAPLPVALVPRYQLTLTDAAAAAAAIADEYSPTDHWQWVATLWRGTVGPDVTVDVRAPAPDNAENGGGGGGGGVGLEGGKAVSGAQAVDVKLAEARAVLIRGEGKGRVSESALRRVGFEVGEWLRSKGERVGG